MDKDSVRNLVLEYLEAPEANEGAQICIDTITGSVAMLTEEEADAQPDTTDVYDVLDFIKMTPEGEWIADDEAIALL